MTSISPGNEVVRELFVSDPAIVSRQLLNQADVRDHFEDLGLKETGRRHHARRGI
jgi:hypothetical protein